MTAGQAIEQADELRPNNQFTDSLKQSWLHQCDARMRTSIVQRSRTADFDAVGADVNWNEGLEYETVLLAPEAFCPFVCALAVCADGSGAGRDSTGHE